MKTLLLYSTLGSIVRTVTGIVSNQVIIERGSLSNGVYLFQLSTGDKVTQTGKVIIN